MLRCHPTKLQSTQAMEPDLTGYAKQPCHHHVGVCCYLKPHVMDMLPPIPYVLWVHGQGLTSLGHNQCTEMLSNPAIYHPDCRTRLGRICKTTMPSSGWCILVGEEPHAMDTLPWMCYHIFHRFMGAWSRYNNHGI